MHSGGSSPLLHLPTGDEPSHAHPRPFREVITYGLVPANTHVTKRLVVGAGLFGVAWGVAGVCPGPAVVSWASGVSPGASIFFPGLILGFLVFEYFHLHHQHHHSAAAAAAASSTTASTTAGAQGSQAGGKVNHPSRVY